MKSNIKETLSKMSATTSPEMMDQFMDLLNLPDEQFDAVYPRMKSELDKAFKSAHMSEEVLRALKASPIQDPEQEKAAMMALIEEIETDDSLSQNKRDFLCGMFNSIVDVVMEMAENMREKIPVRIMKTRPDAVLPTYAHPSDAGADIYAVEGIAINASETTIVKTGLKVAIPAGYEIQVRPRSGLSLKTNLRIPNTPGTIDSNYRGEIGVLMTNIGNKTEIIKKGDKIAQMIIAPSPMIAWEEVEELDATDRNEGGFGSTGVNTEANG